MTEKPWAHGNDGWVYVSTWKTGAQPVPATPGDINAGDDNNWHPYMNEILRVKVKPCLK